MYGLDMGEYRHPAGRRFTLPWAEGFRALASFLDLVRCLSWQVRHLVASARNIFPQLVLSTRNLPGYLVSYGRVPMKSSRVTMTPSGTALIRILSLAIFASKASALPMISLDQSLVKYGVERAFSIRTSRTLSLLMDNPFVI